MAFYLATGPASDPTRRSYYREVWNEKSWWLPWHYDQATQQWLVTTVPGAPAVMPTTYRTIEDARAKLDTLSTSLDVFVVNATTGQRVDDAPARSIPLGAPVCAESIR